MLALASNMNIFKQDIFCVVLILKNVFVSDHGIIIVFVYLAHQFLFLLCKILNNFKHSVKISTFVV